ncbi:MAG: TonB-dependent receptor [Burkholderiaceae bacterium]|nr:TonB-dependent receptor [Burkholderiaceae bacterium]
MTAVPGACTDVNFWTTGSGTCSYDFNKVAADEAALTNSSLFLRGEMTLNADWSVFVNTSVSRVESFGRYAPVPGLVEVAAGSPNNPTGGASDVALYHRFAAAGNRDNNTENNLYDVMAGVQGRIGDVDVELGVRNTESKYNELGRNYIVRPLAEQYINSGAYDIYTPSQNPAEILNSIKATISRDAFFKHQEVFGRATFDLFPLAGGMSRLSVGSEFRSEDYADQYDSLQEAGVIEGASGNSAAGSREVLSGMVEIVLPITKTIELDLAGRYERYSDYGSDFAPKASVRWQPMRGLVFRGSMGQGFRAPSLPVLNAQPQFSAESVFDPRTCIAFGGPVAGCNSNTTVQIDAYVIANPTLKSEQSDQFSFGVVWDVTRSLNVKVDYWNTKIDDTITLIDAQDIVDRSNGDDARAIPAGLGITRAADGSIIEIRSGYANEGTLKASGLDIGIGFNYQLANVGNFRHDLLVSWLMKQDVDGTDLIADKDQGLPEYRASLQNAWRRGQFNAAWNVNYIGKNGADALATKEYTTHDVSFDWAPGFSKGTKLTVGVINLFDKMPELIPYDGRNFNFYLYDSYGRTPYVRVSHKF